jgi:hypothetical protein
MGIKAHAVVVLTTALVACSTFSSPAECGHTYCQNFDEPVGAPWSLEIDNSTETITGGRLEIEVPPDSNGRGTRLYLRLPAPATHIKCGVTVTVTKASADGDIYLMAVAVNGDAPNTFVGASLSSSALSLVLGTNAPVGTGAIALQTPTTLVLEVDGDQTMPALVRGDARTSTSQAWSFGKPNQFFFGLKPDSRSSGPWAATFDDAWCDVTE